MIFVRDKGQMCNNILQYGHMYAWGREHCRKTVSMRFAYKYQYFKICSTKYHWFVTYLFAKWGAALGLLPRVTFPFERCNDYTPLETQLLSHKHCIAEGWRVEFPELFVKYKAEIIDLFTFKQSITDKVRAAMKHCDDERCVRLGVHIRRGDYARWMDGKYFFDDAVYANYIKAFMDMNKGKDIAVYISTNDATVSEEKFRELCGIENIFKLNGNPAEDLCMLSLCDDVIGPPSTFSLVAVMYRDEPLHWMFSKDSASLKTEGFDCFDHLFRKVL